MNTDSVRSVEQLLWRIPFFVSDYNLKLFQFTHKFSLIGTRIKVFESQVTLIWSKVQRLRLTVILPRIISCLFVILSNKSMNKEIGKYFFAFVYSSKSFAIVCVVVFPFVLLLSIFWTAHCFLYVWLIVVVCTSSSILGHTWEKVSGKCSIDLKLFVWEH